jgi:hypothetical protein
MAHLLRVYFPGVTQDDTVTSIGGGSYNGISVSKIPGTNAQFYTYTDTNGNQWLATVKTDQLALTGVFTTAGTTNAVLIPVIDVIEEHPPHAPH